MATKSHTKKTKTKIEETNRTYLYSAFIVFPILFIIVAYILCALHIFCPLGTSSKTLDSNLGTHVSQHLGQDLELHGDTLALSNGNSVSLSTFHDIYQAGTGLTLNNSDHTFSLTNTGVTSGTYGSAYAVPVVTVDDYGRITNITTQPIASTNSGSSITINSMIGPSFTITGANNQVSVTNNNNEVKLTLPQDIGVASSVQFDTLTLTSNLDLHANIVDAFGNAGLADQVLTVAIGGVKWTDLNTLTSDDQNLSWDGATNHLGIESGNTVDLSALAVDTDDQTLNWNSTTNILGINAGNTVDLSTLANVWKVSPIGGSYTTDLVEPTSTNVQKIKLVHTAWGLTEMHVRNEDNTSNYSGAVLSLKGSGPDYTNNMFFAKLGDNYYVPSWAGAGVVSTDQKLRIASVQSNDPAHPNAHPEILFQVGGHYDSPIDRMILDERGYLGVGNTSPDERMTIAGNIHLTDDKSFTFLADGTFEMYTKVNTEDGIGDIIIHPGVDSNSKSGSPQNVTIYPGLRENGHLYGNVILGANEKERAGKVLVGNASEMYTGDYLMQVINANDVATHSFIVSRSAEKTDNGPVIDYMRAGDKMAKVDKDFITGGFFANPWSGKEWVRSAGIVARVREVVDDKIIPTYLQFLTMGDKGGLSERMRIMANGRVGVGTTSPSVLFQVGDKGDGSYALANAWSTFSDRRFKKQIKNVQNALKKVLEMQGVYYKWKDSSNKKRQIGFIAQDMQKVLPEVVYKTKDGYYSIDYSKLTPILVEAMKDLYKKFEKFEDQSKKIEELEKENKELHKRLDEVEQRLSKLEGAKKDSEKGGAKDSKPLPKQDSSADNPKSKTQDQGSKNAKSGENSTSPTPTEKPTPTHTP